MSTEPENGAETEPAGRETPSVTPNPPKTLRGGVIPHVLTTEDRRKGQRVQAERRREAAKPLMVKIAEGLERESSRIVAAYLRAIESGDWRAAGDLMDRTFGRATTRVETTEIPAGADWESASPAERRLMREQVRRRLRLVRPDAEVDERATG